MTRETSINLVLALLLLSAPFIAIAVGEGFYVTLATRIAILALAGIGLNLALGLGGLVSFGHAAFFGIGGYAAGLLAAEGVTDMPLIWLLGAGVAGLVALVTGAVSLRTAGVYFIMITLAFAQMIYYFVISWPALGGEDGLSLALRNAFPFVNTLKPLNFFLICYGLLLLALWLFQRLRDSRFGAALQGARQNETRLASLGIDVFPVRLSAFAISAMITGVAGALYADLTRFVSPSMLSWQMSGELIVIVILGGVGRLCGPLAGAAVFVLLEF
ncbi:MAG TPA: branched-chain amino acid ABC transporter permease, partial [Nordella sp.]|nr:branched-chain amino acid ABC transporter permease [Nordella sp.]